MNDSTDENEKIVLEQSNGSTLIPESSQSSIQLGASLNDSDSKILPLPANNTDGQRIRSEISIFDFDLLFEDPLPEKTVDERLLSEFSHWQIDSKRISISLILKCQLHIFLLHCDRIMIKGGKIKITEHSWSTIHVDATFRFRPEDKSYLANLFIRYYQIIDLGHLELMSDLDEQFSKLKMLDLLEISSQDK